MKKNKSHSIQDISFSESTMHLIVDGVSHDIDLLKFSYRLGVATKKQREHVIVTDDGVGLYWPDIDEGLLVDIMIGTRKMLPHEARSAWELYMQGKSSFRT